MTLSIIIPVYNIGPYIQRCVDSIINQKRSDIEAEIILVDDGSTDTSGVICDKLSDRYDNIVVIHQPNGGQSDARNHGLGKATGDYVWFVDGDDYIEDDSLEQLSAFIGQSPDIISISYKQLFDDGTIEECVSEINQSNTSFSGIDALSRLGAIPAWASIFRCRFLLENKLYFAKGIIHEDFEFGIRSYSLAKKVIAIDASLYNYECQRQGSTMNSISARSPIGYAYSAVSIHEFISKNNFSDSEIASIMKVVAIGITFSFERLLYTPASVRQKVMEFYNLNKKLISRALHYHSVFYKIIGLIFSFSPRIALNLFKCAKSIP